MIGSLRGSLVEAPSEGELLVECGGVGYRVTVAPASSLAFGEAGAAVFVWVHHHIREDAQTLYGFASRAERTCFETLLRAHGVGPALALAILSVHGPDELGRIVAHEDLAALCLVPGVGKRTAERLLVELRDRLDLTSVVAAGASANGDAGAPTVVVGEPSDDVRAALAELGYGPDEIRSALKDVPDGEDASAMLRTALRRLAVT
ncbi:MAG: Holliday junction branch migration protein RuvA [Actinomycetota bacterium]|nr:Holliday junction branch migration protein RuvA [Actinomycetota bacterium]